MLDAVAAVKDKHEIMPLAACSTAKASAASSMCMWNRMPRRANSTRSMSANPVSRYRSRLLSEERRSQQSHASGSARICSRSTQGSRHERREKKCAVRLRPRSQASRTSVDQRSGTAIHKPPTTRRRIPNWLRSYPNLNWPKFVSGLGFDKEASSIVQQSVSSKA